MPPQFEPDLKYLWAPVAGVRPSVPVVHVGVVQPLFDKDLVAVGAPEEGRVVGCQTIPKISPVD